MNNILDGVLYIREIILVILMKTTHMTMRHLLLYTCIPYFGISIIH